MSCLSFVQHFQIVLHSKLSVGKCAVFCPKWYGQTFVDFITPTLWVHNQFIYSMKNDFFIVLQCRGGFGWPLSFLLFSLIIVHLAHFALLNNYNQRCSLSQKTKRIEIFEPIQNFLDALGYQTYQKSVSLVYSWLFLKLYKLWKILFKLEKFSSKKIFEELLDLFTPLMASFNLQEESV